MTKYIIANWKMNPAGSAEAQELFKKIQQGIGSTQNSRVVICPPFVHLPLLKGLPLGAQNVSCEDKGAFTGEISAAMLVDLGVTYVILGHSEVRRYLHETDEMISRKITAAQSAGLQPILCIGEQEGESKENVFNRQLQGLDLSNVIVAYEPIWAIGTGKNCSVQETKESIALIQEISGKKTSVLYGGSAKPENAADYLKEPAVSGLLIGGASLDAEKFVAIIRISQELS